MTITTFATFGLIQNLYRYELTLLVTRNHHLGNTLTILNNKVLVRQVDEHHTYLATIVGIDSTWGVKYGDTLL